MAKPKSEGKPELETERLFLRLLETSDAEAVRKGAGAREIADTTLSIPHPCTLADAQSWIKTRIVDYQSGKTVPFGIVLKQSNRLIGAIGLKDIDREHEQAELGFWIEISYWNQGYATEAALSVLRFGFGALKLNRIHAHHMVRNPKSGNVLKKIGMIEEGTLRQRVKKWDVFEDVVLYAILKRDFEDRFR